MFFRHNLTTKNAWGQEAGDGGGAAGAIQRH